MNEFHLNNVEAEQRGDLIEKVSGIAALLTAISESGNANIKAIDALAEYVYTVRDEFKTMFCRLKVQE